MRGNISQKLEEEIQEDGHHYKGSEFTEKRLDLNDLLRRLDDRKKNDKKINLLIFSGAASLVLVVFLVLSL